MDNGKVNILVVDDRPEKVMALEAVLEALGENIVHAYTGREALRALLNQDFAVILLDINMPGMDGFETASLIRQRQHTRDVPIIFVTAYQDEVQATRGYSLGAVDYIQAPVVPEILRTKVGVFVDLCKKTEQVKRQAAWLQQRATQLHKLTAASLAINSAMSLEQLLEVVTEAARDVIGVHMAFTSAVLDQDWRHTRTAASVSEKLPAFPTHLCKLEGSGVRLMVCQTNKSMRMTRKELQEHPAWGAEAKACCGVPLSGWLAAPLTGRNGRNFGLIEVSDRLQGEFCGDDEALLVQLAQMASIAIENTVFATERETSRMKDEFLWMLSHELRTPLNAILGWTQLLAREKKVSENIREGLEVIDRNARAQAKLVEAVLELSRIATGTLRLSIGQVYLGRVIQAAVESIRPAAHEKNIALECSIPESPIQLAADPDRLQQVAWNLLSNAVKFTPAGGRVHIEVERMDLEASIRVTDTGQGIKPALLPHVFDRFRQGDSSTTRAHRGLGIGLTIVRHFVELHDGTVEAWSPGENLGSTFIVRLPIRVPPAQSENGKVISTSAPQADAQPGSEVTLAGVHVLLVDDEPDGRKVVGALLNRLQAEVTLAGSAAEALDAIKRCRPHVLVSDIAMPEQDGYDLIRAVRRLKAEDGGQLPAIAITAYAREEDRALALAAGFQNHVPKPIDPAKLASTIQQLVGSGSPASNGITPQPLQAKDKSKAPTGKARP